MAIDFYLDFISPFGYLARQRLLDIANRYRESIVYRPVDIMHLRLNAGNTGPSNSKIPSKMAYFKNDYLRWAQHYGMPIVQGLAGAATGVFNRGLYLAIERNRADAYVEHAWACIWRDGLDPGHESAEAELEKRMGWTTGDLGAFANTPTIAERYAAEVAAASRRGVFGVPTFFIGDEMWWGNDRLDFLERYLAAR